MSVIVGALLAAPLAAQTPQPFPRPGETPPPRQPSQPPPSTQPAPIKPVPPPAAGAAQPQTGVPPASEVYFPIYPAAQFLASYDAGRGQRYYVYGASASFTEVVMYYRTQLDERGTLVFKEPPTHMFEVGRFRDETMAFPPGVTVKDWTWGGSTGYLNPRPRSQPERFPTIIMIVPPQPQTAAP